MMLEKLSTDWWLATTVMPSLAISRAIKENRLTPTKKDRPMGRPSLRKAP
jgi:hypothetical protein